MDIFAISAGGCLVLILGIVDGFRPLWAVGKLGVLLGVTFLLSHFGVRINLTGIWGVDVVLTLMWIAGVSSAMNSLDNMDGAAGGRPPSRPSGLSTSPGTPDPGASPTSATSRSPSWAPAWASSATTGHRPASSWGTT